MSDTKSKIIEEAEILFFREGIANSRLQQIADASGISVGNLAYHFKNKDAIVTTVYENLFNEFSKILSEYMINPRLSGFDDQFSALFKFYSKNNFTYNNSWEIARNYPSIQQDWLTLNNKILLQLKKRIDYNVVNKNLLVETFKGQYENLAQTLLLTINSWLPQQMLRNKSAKEDLFKKNLWSLIYPNFTQKGKQEFEQTIVPYLI